MGNEANWNTFTQTGKVSDYLAYVREEKGRNGQNDIQGGCYQLFIPDRHRIVLCVLSYDGGR